MDVENKLMVSRRQGGGGGINWGIETDIYTVLYKKRITITKCMVNDWIISRCYHSDAYRIYGYK